MIEELIEEEQIQEDFDDMMAEEEEHYNNSIQILPYEEEIDTELPEEDSSRSQTDDYDSVQTQQDETSTVIPETTNNVPWSNETNEISAVSCDDVDVLMMFLAIENWLFRVIIFNAKHLFSSSTAV